MQQPLQLVQFTVAQLVQCLHVLSGLHYRQWKGFIVSSKPTVSIEWCYLQFILLVSIGRSVTLNSHWYLLPMLRVWVSISPVCAVGTGFDYRQGQFLPFPQHSSPLSGSPHTTHVSFALRNSEKYFLDRFLPETSQFFSQKILNPVFFKYNNVFRRLLCIFVHIS